MSYFVSNIHFLFTPFSPCQHENFWGVGPYAYITCIECTTTMSDVHGVSLAYEWILYHYVLWNSEHSSFDNLKILYVGYFLNSFCCLMELHDSGHNSLDLTQGDWFQLIVIMARWD